MLLITTTQAQSLKHVLFCMFLRLLTLPALFDYAIIEKIWHPTSVNSPLTPAEVKNKGFYQQCSTDFEIQSQK